FTTTPISPARSTRRGCESIERDEMPETSTIVPKTVRAVFDDLKPGSAKVELANEATVAAEAKSQAGVIEWKATSSALIPEVAKLLDVPLPALLVGFWKKTDEVAAALGKSLASPTKNVDVSLFDSKTEASFDPFIEVRLNGVE